MSDPQTSSAQAGIAEARGDLSEQTRVLVRAEIDAAQRETWVRARRTLPGVLLLGTAGVLGVFSAASAFTLGLRLLEKALPKASAALVATATSGAAAGVVTAAGVRRLRAAPVPFPVDTAMTTGRAAADVARSQTG